MERKKIAFACFWGGIVTTALWLLLSAETNKVFALLAGFCAGYLGYEFREVLAAIPKAFWATVGFGRETWNSWINFAQKWLEEPHPFLYASILIGLPFAAKGSWIFVTDVLNSQYLPSDMFGWFIAYIIGFGFFTTLAGLIVLWPLARLGAWYWEKSFWRMKCFSPEQEIDENKRCEDYQRSSLTQKELTYKNVYRWVVEGLLLVVAASLALPFFVGYHVARSATKFGWHLFRLIHSYRRVLCGVDGMIGGWIAGQFLTSPAMSFAQVVAVIITGGLIGAVLGIANWELVSVRLLKVHQKA